MLHSVMSWVFVALLCVAGGCSKSGSSGASATPPATVTAPANGRVEVVVDATGYHPSTINASAGQALTLVFRRTSDEGCGQQVVFPAQHIQRDLPLNQPVEVTITPSAGTLSFTCGMNMYRGSVVVR